MSWRCDLTGKKPLVGHKVSHSNIKTKRRFLPNLRNVTGRHIYEAMVSGPQSMPVFNDDNISPQGKASIIAFLHAVDKQKNIDAVVLSVFQRPEALKAMGISEAVRQQAGAYYLFSNPGATAKDYDEFDLTPRELGFGLGQTQPARRIARGMLIKRPMTRESVIVDIDFTCLGPYLKFFSSSAKDVALVNDLQRQLGPVWVDRIVDHEAP